MTRRRVRDGAVHHRGQRDDYQLYALLSGRRPLQGDVDVNGFDVLNPGNVDGRDVSADGVALDALDASFTAHAADSSIHEPIPAALTELTDGSYTRLHRHYPPTIYTFVDMDFDLWLQAVNGSATGFMHNPSGGGYSFVNTLPGGPWYRMTVGANDSASDQARLIFGDASKWTSISAGEFLFECRVIVADTSSYRFTIGYTTSTSSTVALPAPYFLFDISSSNTNVRCKYDNNAGGSSDQDSGVTCASLEQTPAWLGLGYYNGAMRFLIDGTEVANVAEANFPTGNDLLQHPRFYWEHNGATWRSLLMDTVILSRPESIFDDSLMDVPE